MNNSAAQQLTNSAQQSMNNNAQLFMTPPMTNNAQPQLNKSAQLFQSRSVQPSMNRNAQPPTSKLAVTSRPAQPLMKLSVITTLEESSTEEDLEDQRRRNLRM